MNEKFRLVLVLAFIVGMMVLLISTHASFGRRLIVGQRQSSTTNQDTESATVDPPWRYRTSGQTNYISQNVGDEPALYNKRMLKYIRRNISPPSKEIPYHLAVENNADFSQFGQSTYVDKLLSGRRRGFFIECGAADGDRLSNSLFFELERNWTGILIEANPHYRQTILSKKRNAYVLTGCLSSERRSMTVRMQTAGVCSQIVGATNSSRSYSGHPKRKPDVIVKCFPLNTIMAALNVFHVDYFSLDVEGPEIEILRTVDWTRLRIDVITVEYRVLNDRNHRVNKMKTLRKLEGLRQFFRETGIYREVGRLPGGNVLAGLDIVFSRI